MDSNFTGGLFESLAADDSDKRIAHRKSLAVANKRVVDRFGAFLAAAENSHDRTARLDLIRADVQEVVASVCGEYGGDPDRIERNIFSHLSTKEHMKGVGDKRNRQYEHVLASCKESHPDWDEDRCKEYAARTTNKTRAEKGETNSKTAASDPFLQEQQNESLGDTVENWGGEQQSETVDITPDVEGIQRWIENVRRTDPGLAAQMEAALHGGGPGPDPYADPNAMGNPYPQDTPDADGLELPSYGSSVHTARRPKMCPYHREVTDISLASGDPTAGFSTMAQHAWGPQHCQGEYEGGCNFKREMVTQKYWDDKAQLAEERRQERELQRQQELEVQQEPEFLQEGESVEFAEEGQLDTELSEAPSAIGEGVSETPSMSMGELEPMAAKVADACPDSPGEGGHITNSSGECVYCGKYVESGDARSEDEKNSRVGEALKTVEVDQGSADDPSPEMNKNKIPKDGLGEPEGIEMEGSPHPTETIDPLVPIQAQNDEEDFLQGTKAVTETQDVTQDSSFDGDKADSGSWAGNNNASPVASSKESASVDPDVNPIRQVLEDLEDGFVPHSQVQAAIKEWEDESGT